MAKIEVKAPKAPNVWLARIAALAFLVLGMAVGYFTYYTETTPQAPLPFRLGLDLAGGAHLVYRADVSGVDPAETEEALEALRAVIERRVNSRDLAGVTGVLDPSVQLSQSSVLGGTVEHRLIVELPGVTNVEEAKQLIGVTPLLEFKLVEGASDGATSTYATTGLTGRYLNRARLEFMQQTSGAVGNQPQIVLEFNEEGAARFQEITRNNIGKQLAIFLDGISIEEPVIREEIPGGTAVITGNFTPAQAREVVRNLNLGALPVPIEPVSTQSIGPSLGAETLSKGMYAGIWGLLAVALFMVIWYRLPGVVAALALGMYLVINLAIFKLIPVTLTAAGIAGFILTVGMAVDANILIFERMREELAKGKSLALAVQEGFSRAWLSIRDGNVAAIITAVIIFYAGTFLTKGFAVTLIIGTLVSMFTAISLTRSLLMALGFSLNASMVRKLYGQGIHF